MWLYAVVIFNQFIYGEFFVVVFNVTYQFTLVLFIPNFVKFPQKYFELRGGCMFQVLIGDIIFSKNCFYAASPSVMTLIMEQ